MGPAPPCNAIGRLGRAKPEAHCSITPPRFRTVVSANIRLPLVGDNGPGDQVQTRGARERYDRLNIKSRSLTVWRPEASIPVQLDRQRDQRRQRVGQLLSYV